MQIGIRIKKLRKQRGWSQDELCYHAGLKREYLSRVENEHTTPALSTLQRIAGAFQISLAHLLDVNYKNEYTGHKTPTKTVSQEKANYVLTQEILQEIETIADELCTEFKRRIKYILGKNIDYRKTDQ